MIAGAMFERPSGFSVPGARSSVHLLGVHDLLHHACAASAPFFGPRDRGVARVGEGAVPVAKLLELFVVDLHRAAETRSEVGREIGLEPVAKLLAERFGFGRIREVHDLGVVGRASSASSVVQAAAGERGLDLTLLRHVLGVQLLGRTDAAVDLELAHDVDLAEGLLHVVRALPRSG